MKQVAIFLIVIIFLTSACGVDNTASVEKNSMPNKMPNDFEFIVQFGVQSRNEVNTFNNTVTKDLIIDGTATANITFTNDEMSRVYEKMRNINIIEKKDLIPKSSCSQQPHTENKWEIKINGKTITHYVSEMYCYPTDDAKQLIKLRNFIFDLVKNKKEYKELPTVKGAYH